MRQAMSDDHSSEVVASKIIVEVMMYRGIGDVEGDPFGRVVLRWSFVLQTSRACGDDR